MLDRIAPCSEFLRLYLGEGPLDPEDKRLERPSMDLMLIAAPLFFLAIAWEILWNHRIQGGFYRVNDTISNITAGMVQQLIGALPLLLSVLSYTWLYKQFCRT